MFELKTNVIIATVKQKDEEKEEKLAEGDKNCEVVMKTTA